MYGPRLHCCSPYLMFVAFRRSEDLIKIPDRARWPWAMFVKFEELRVSSASSRSINARLWYTINHWHASAQHGIRIWRNLRTLFTGTGPLQRDKADAPGGETAYSETSGTGRVCLQTRAIFVLYGLSGSPLARLCVFACLAQALDWGHVAQT